MSIYYRVSPNKIYFISEYWLLIPLVAAADCFIISKMRKYKTTVQELKKLEDRNKILEQKNQELKSKIRQSKRLKKVLYLSLSVNAYNFVNSSFED